MTNTVMLTPPGWEIVARVAFQEGHYDAVLALQRMNVARAEHFYAHERHGDHLQVPEFDEHVCLFCHMVDAPETGDPWVRENHTELAAAMLRANLEEERRRRSTVKRKTRPRRRPGGRRR